MIEKFSNFANLKTWVNARNVIVDKVFPVETYDRYLEGGIYNHDWEWVLVYHYEKNRRNYEK